MAMIAGRLILIAFIITAAEGRILRLNSSGDHLISDGISDPETSCRHQYGFLPCAENALGYIFMIVVYQVLLIVGEKLIGSSSEVLFYITGPEFGGILFRILRALPSMMLMILTGIFSDKEGAQSQVSVVVGVYAGITVLSLTVQWIMCLVSASKSLKEEKEEERENSKSIKEMFRILIGHGVKVDKKTCKTARIMLLSLVPYLVLQLIYIFTTSSQKRVMTIIALTVSSLSLISYFAYQIRNPWMQERSLDYSNLDNVQKGFMKHMEQLGKLMKEDGSLDVDIIKRYFKKADQDNNNCIAAEELEKLVREVFKHGEAHVDQTEAIGEVMNQFDNDRNKKINEFEFIEGFKKWIHEATKNSSSNNFNPSEMIRRTSLLLRDKNQNNFPEIDKIMSKIVKQAEDHMMRSASLITSDGEPNLESIQRLFKEYDSNGDGSLTSAELKKLISKVKFGAHGMKNNDVIKEMFRALDKDGNEVIDEEEFVVGVKGYLEKAMKYVDESERSKAIDEYDKMVWRGEVHDKYGKKDFFVSIFHLLLGIAMLTFLGGPLMTNILELSNAMNFPSFIISFVVVPLAMNARAALAAILPASKKTKETSSLTFSEIYGGVIMNNISGLTILLAIVCAKDLTWDFSAEVLTILVVCGIIGIQALSKTYYLWTCVPAFLLYPISLGLFYFFQVFLGWN